MSRVQENEGRITNFLYSTLQEKATERKVDIGNFMSLFNASITLFKIKKMFLLCQRAMRQHDSCILAENWWRIRSVPLCFLFKFFPTEYILCVNNFLLLHFFFCDISAQLLQFRPSKRNKFISAALQCISSRSCRTSLYCEKSHVFQIVNDATYSIETTLRDFAVRPLRLEL